MVVSHFYICQAECRKSSGNAPRGPRSNSEISESPVLSSAPWEEKDEEEEEGAALAIPNAVFVEM